MRARAKDKRTLGAIFALMFTCLLAYPFWNMPCLAWAGESDDIPIGVLTLCDDPFAIDCNHDTPTCHHEVSNMGDCLTGSLNDKEAIPVVNDSGGTPVHHSEQAEVFQEEADVPDFEYSAAMDQNDAEIATAIQTPSSEHASTYASNPSEPVTVPAASFEDARIVVEDEGLYRHERAAVLVEVKAGISRDEFSSLIDSIGGLRADDVSDEDLAYGLVRLGISDKSTVMGTIDRLKEAPGFLSVQPNYVYKTRSEESAYTDVDDTYAYQQWGLYNTNAFAAWDLVKTKGSVAVAVIDTGIDLDHPDLASNVIATRNAYAYNNTVEDMVGHGTHVAGIIAGIANNGEGIAGVSYDAGLVIIKATSYKSTDFDTASLVRAYAWLESLDSSGGTVAQHYNVRIVNLSIGGFDDERIANHPDDVLNQAMRKAQDEYGLLTVVAAGNNLPYAAPYFAYPGDSDACFCVMNLSETYDDDGLPTGYDLDPTSNYNVTGTRSKDICAPGTDIYSTWTEGRYAIDSGTSMAAPFVSGIAALVLAANPYFTPHMLKSILEFTADDLGDEGWDELYGYGGINAAAAVRLANAARIDGIDVVGVGGEAAYEMSLGLDMVEDGSGYTWDVWNFEGSASIDSDGVLLGWGVGEVTLVSTCTATTGAEISATRTVYIIDPEIVGDNTLVVGESSSAYTTTDSRWMWVWQVENLTGSAHIDQDAILVADKPGIVYVSATCASNTDIVIERRVVITA